jgi:hypothetical protein
MRSGKIDDDFDVVRLPFEGLRALFDWLAPREQSVEPRLVRSLQRLASHFIMPAFRIHRAEHGVVVKHHGAIECSDIEVKVMAGRRDTNEADDSGRCRATENVAQPVTDGSMLR